MLQEESLREYIRFTFATSHRSCHGDIRSEPIKSCRTNRQCDVV